MACIYPGRVLIAPKGHDTRGPRLVAESIAKELDSDFGYEYGIQDILAANELRLPKNFNLDTLPFVARVPEGTEAEIAQRIAMLPNVAAAIPDYEVRPSSPVTFDSGALQSAIAAMGATPGGAICGTGSVVGVLDSGIDLHSIVGVAVDQRQYDALDPRGAGQLPSDSNGHGTLVAKIISQVAPGARLISIKTMDDKSTVSSVLAAMYLAQAAGPCDVLNLSLSIECGVDACNVCGAPTVVAASLPQMQYFFDIFMQQSPGTVLVAAAGNNVSLVQLPAALDKVIAVGSFDYATSTPISKYRQVPPYRFVMAAGGRAQAGSAFASLRGFSTLKYLQGTSFATAFVTGFAAKSICRLRSPTCVSRLAPPPGPLADPLGAVLQELYATAIQNWPGYNPMHHGIGALHF